MKKNLAVIILAAGKGVRMKSDLPKVLHPVCGRPMLGYVLDLAKSLKPKATVVVLGHKHAEVKKFLPAGVKSVVQKKLIGTADAMKTALTALKGFSGTVLVLYGDIPLLKKSTLDKLLNFHFRNNPGATILFAQLEKPQGYGRILRDKLSSIRGIIEEKDADEFQKDIKEINTGIICFNKEKLSAYLKEVKANNRKKEYYLTDLIGIFYKNGLLVEGIKIDDINEAMGINSRMDLAKASLIMRSRVNEKLMQEGVTIVSPDTAVIDYGAKVGRDSVIYPFTAIESDVKIGKRCQVGPFVHLRPGTDIADDTVIGNFIEVVRTKIGSKTFVKHFTYLGDARVGKLANIGAGTVTANFDGKKKNLTAIGDGAFIGSDTVIVAPAKIGKNAKTGAGSIVLKNIPDGATAVGVPAKIIKNKG